MNEKPARQITGRMVLLGLIAFFGVVAAVNGAFMYFALSTWPGLTTEDAYQKGLGYNRTLDEAAAQRLLGWKTQVIVDADKLTVRILDGHGAPVAGAVAQAILTRAVGDDRKIILPLDETAAGQYGVTFKAPLPGRWKVEVAVQLGGKRSTTRHEILVAP